MNDLHPTLEAIWRIESPQLIATLARMVGDVGLAEDLAQDAFVTALEKWPHTGLPDRPGAWLMATARRRAIDLLRKRSLHGRKEGEIGAEIAGGPPEDLDAAIDDDIGDDLLRLMFTACHPVQIGRAHV